MKITLVAGILLVSSGSIAQTQSLVSTVSLSNVTNAPEQAYIAVLSMEGKSRMIELGDSKDLPDYKLYKGGYNLVLDEQWEEARKKFTDLIKQFPKSDYIDDARYWSAYALMHIDKKKAAAEYKKFLSEFPHSEYYDDASSDLSQLNARAVVVGNINRKIFTFTDSDSDLVGTHEYFVREKDGKGYSYGYGPNMKVIERQMRSLKRVHMPRVAPVPMPPSTPHPGITGFTQFDSDIDEDTRLRLEALDALGEKEDSASFRALRDIALNRSKNRLLRISAMERLVDFRKFDVLPIFLDVAREDTGEDIQGQAIEFVAMVSPDKNRSVESLIDLFNAIPKERIDRRANVFYSIAEVGNDRAIDFLSSVARADKNYDLRREAIYYLGSIGSPRARQALVEILQAK